MTSRAGAAERNAVMQGSPANLTNAIDIVRSPHPAAGLPRTLRTPITHGAKYFDVTGADPMMVTYTGGGAQPLMWCDCEAMMAMPMDAMMAMMPMGDCPHCMQG